ncbi:MAG: methyltransferase domain-containing protein [Clostridiales bacterium]|nr:methyltransferase domain-containing protein [Clostridiales bacterium]
MIDLLALQKEFLSSHLHEGNTAVDFTMGNGYDTVFLSKAVGKTGSVTAFDIQSSALDSTRENLRKNDCPDNWRLICASHDRAHEFINGKIKAGMFNLGYLPGSGNKSLTTERRTTLPAVRRAISMLDSDAVLTVAVYPGHAEGTAEGRELEKYLSSLSRFHFSVSQIKMLNSPDSPFFMVIETPKPKDQLKAE